MFDEENINEIFNIDSPTSGSMVVSNNKSDMVIKDGDGIVVPNVEKIYGELGNLIKTGNDILKSAEYLVSVEPDGESIAGAAQMINSVKDVIREFSKLHTNHIRHQQNMELEKLKQDNREKLLEIKYKKEQDLKKNPALIGDDGNVINTVGFNQEKVIQEIIDAETVEED